MHKGETAIETLKLEFFHSICAVLQKTFDVPRGRSLENRRGDARNKVRDFEFHFFLVTCKYIKLLACHSFVGFGFSRGFFFFQERIVRFPAVLSLFPGMEIGGA